MRRAAERGEGGPGNRSRKNRHGRRREVGNGDEEEEGGWAMRGGGMGDERRSIEL
jgi:hypothetical protein